MRAVRTSPHLAPAALARARALRRDMTPAERRLWSALRATFRDAHFRHQVPLGPYYPDFASHRARLAIEVDGGQHGTERDAARTRFLEGEGYRVLRFWNNEVLENLDGVLQVIAAALPSPLVGVLMAGGSKRSPGAFLNHAGGMIYPPTSKTGGAKRRMGGARRSRAPAPRAGTPTPRPPRKGEGAKGQPPVGVN